MLSESNSGKVTGSTFCPPSVFYVIHVFSMHRTTF